MIFTKGRKPHRSMSVALFASLAFIALAIWGWDLPPQTVFKFFWICLVLLMVVIATAALLLAIIKFPQYWRERNKTTD